MKFMYALIGLLVLTGNLRAHLTTDPLSDQQVTTPVLSVTPKTGVFYGMQLGKTQTLVFTIRNTGASILNIKKIEVTGSDFALIDTIRYPFEVVADTGAAFPVGNSGKYLKFSVTFAPASPGLKTGKVTISHGLFTEEVFELPLSGEGLSCLEAVEAHRGENWAPKPDSWFRYTADKFSIVEINACHPSQQDSAGRSREFWPYAYSDCRGTIISLPEEPMFDYCPNQSQEFIIQHVMTAGETIYLFWPKPLANSWRAGDGFFFNIIATYPTDGDVCENAIPLTLPVVNHFGNTRGFNDDYNISPCSPFNDYMGGNDKVYSVTLEQEGYLTGSILGAYAAVHVLDICPKEELEKSHCKGFAGGSQGGSFRKKIAPGTYFVIVSNWPPPQTVDYLLNLSFEEVSAVADETLTNRLTVFPNPARDIFTVSLTLDSPADITLELVSISGQLVYRWQGQRDYYFQDEIDISRLARGIYYLKADTGPALEVRKVIID